MAIGSRFFELDVVMKGAAKGLVSRAVTATRDDEASSLSRILFADFFLFLAPLLSQSALVVLSFVLLLLLCVCAAF